MKAHNITQGGKRHQPKSMADLRQSFCHPLQRQKLSEWTRQMIRQLCLKHLGGFADTMIRHSYLLSQKDYLAIIPLSEKGGFFVKSLNQKQLTLCQCHSVSINKTRCGLTAGQDRLHSEPA
jgi:hypothetical protein